MIKDANGKVIRRLDGATSAGLHRESWNLRTYSLSSSGGSGSLVKPGKYTITAEKRVQDKITTIGNTQTIEVASMQKGSLPAQDINATKQFYELAGQLQRAVRGTSGKVNEVLSQLVEIKQVLKQSGKGTTALLDEARQLELKLKDISELLTGGTVKPRYSEPDVISISSRIRWAGKGMQTTYGPTKTHRRDYQIAKEQFQAVIDQVKKETEVDFVNLQKKLEAAGLPWTSGRPIPNLK